MAASSTDYQCASVATPSREQTDERSPTTAFDGPFDVFINHRGPDVKRNLASILYWWLKSTSVSAFLDTESLRGGDDIPKALEDVMRSVSVHIAIFSENYAQSAWCLNELLIMRDTGITIIPVFYHVRPLDLRYVAKGIGKYAKAFSKHESDGRFGPETLQQWKEALAKVSLLSGHIFNASCDEGVVLNKIVERVHEKTREKRQLYVAKHPVGLDLAVKRFEKLLGCSTVQFVGIVGQGGSGKTTLARELYNRKHSLMDRSSFLFGVRNASQNGGLCKLREQLLADILHNRDGRFHRQSGDEPVRALESQRTLIVLDDVDDQEQLEALLQDKEPFGFGSLIIITTRNSDVLKWGSFSIFKMEMLNSEHATQLFCSHAFSQPEPLPQFKELVTCFVHACGGLPLSLQIFGEMVRGNLNEESWKSKLQSVLRTLPKGIVEVLKVSYDSLEEEQKQMFLDSSCFFIGEEKSLVIEIWDEAGWSGLAGLETLVNKCLVQLDQHGRIRIHDHLRELGIKIASETSPYRIWKAEQIKNIRRHSAITPEIRGIMAAKTQFAGIHPHKKFPICSEYYSPPFQHCMELLENTNRGYSCLRSTLQLKLLVFAEELTGSNFADLSIDLVWLRWFDFKYARLPSWMSLGNLRVLEFCGTLNLEELWPDNARKPPSQLAELTVAANSGISFHTFPSSISQFKCLKRMVLISRSGDEFGFSSLPEEFCELEMLEHLELRCCTALLSLPTRIGALKKLGRLDLCACHRLKDLPKSFKQLVNLTYLNLSECWELTITSDILDNMRKLEKLFFSGCRNLEELPRHLTDQMSLKELYLVGTRLRQVPINLYQLSKLEILEIGSPLLTALPASFYCFLSLTRLSIRNCDNLGYIPNCINSFTRYIQGLAQLQHFCIESSNVNCLQLLSYCQLTNLQTLKISACPIEELCLRPGSLVNLKVLSLTKTRVKSISISEYCCPELETLILRENDDLVVIKVLPPSVNMIELVDCRNLQKIRHLRPRINLKVSGCPKFSTPE